MWWAAICILLAVMAKACKGIEAADKSGIDQFWTEDYKVFDQVYGKTSDKELYGSILPSTITDTGDKKKAASENQERYAVKQNDPDSIEFDRYFNFKLNKLKTKLSGKKPIKSSINYISNSDFNPTSQSAGTETYSYLKFMDDFDKNSKYNHLNTMRGVKPFSSYGYVNSGETDHYRSIQEILQAHESNKANSYGITDDNMKYMKQSENNIKYPSRAYNDVLKPRCLSGRCRKRGLSYKSRSRPHRRPMAKVKKVVVI